MSPLEYNDKNNYIYFLLDILLVLSTFLLIHFIKFGYILPQGTYLVLLLVFLTYWYTLSKYYNKYSLAFASDYRIFLNSLIWSTILSLFLTISITAITNLWDISRLFIIKLTLIPMVIELTIISILRIFLKYKIHDVQKDFQNVKNIQYIKTNPLLLLIGIIMLFSIYFLMIKLKTGNYYLYPWSERILLILIASWFVSTIITKKYSIVKTENIYYQISPFIKSGLIMILIAAMVFFFFRIESISRFLLFGTIMLYTIFEIISFLLYYISQAASISNINTIELNTTNNNLHNWNLNDYNISNEFEKHQIDENINIKSIFSQIHSIEDYEQIVEFLENNLQGLNIKLHSSSIFSTITLENIELLRNNSKLLLINLHKINDIKLLNQYFITCYKKIVPEGILIGNVLPLDYTFHRIQTKMPRIVFTLIYPFHFLVNRIIPKIPKINMIYFFITKGRNREISKAETYGRLNYCGFNIVNDIVINNKLYFIAKKVKTISTVTDPSYHPIINLKRIGLNGKLIKIYKFRTMYPYSEFLQEHMYTQNKLTDSGNKFENDYRITKLGRLLRKFWIDELPQIYNWLHGDLNLVGVRPLSEQYNNLYPKDHQELRKMYKPGLLPPFYVDLPNSLADKINSEREYINQKRTAPVRTDLKYGIRALKNIIFKGIRSS